MMRLHILSDLHLEFAGWSLPEVDADVLCLAGDIHTKGRALSWIQEQGLTIPVLYVLGNHEYYRSAMPKALRKLREATVGTGMHVLDNDAWQTAGLRVLGCTLWSDYALHGDRFVGQEVAIAGMQDYRRIRVEPHYRRLHPNDLYKQHLASLRWLRDELSQPFDGHTVVMTHHAPHPRSLAPSFQNDLLSCAYASDLEGLMLDYQPSLWIHGHTHFRCDYHIGGTRIVSNPRGYADEPVVGFSPDWTITL